MLLILARNPAWDELGAVGIDDCPANAGKWMPVRVIQVGVWTRVT